MSDPPTLMTRLRAKLAGEVATDTIDAYRAAGASAYDLLVDAEQARAALSENDYWEVPDATQSFFLCTWNAFALQSLGDAFIEADFEYDRRTVGFIPPVTAEQAASFYAEVEQWLVRARQAQSDRSYRLDLYVPAELPEWVEVEPCPMPHLHAMLSACRTLREHAAVSVMDLKKRAPAGRAQDVERIDSLLVTATTTADYADQLHGRLHQGQAASQELHERIETSIKDALERAFLVGQLAAMPTLESGVATRVASARKRLPGPGEPGFDPWCLTDPNTRQQWQRDPQAQRAIESLWSSDPDPRRTLDLQAEIDAALDAGEIEYATDAQGNRLGNYYCCPWSAVYVAKRPVKVHGQRLRPSQQFTLDVSAEEILEGGTFKRELLLGSFSPTNEIDYCEPGAGGHAD